VIPLVDRYPRKMKAYPFKNLFIAALSVIAKKTIQPECPQVGKWIDKMWTQTMEYLSAMKRKEDEVLTHATI